MSYVAKLLFSVVTFSENEVYRQVPSLPDVDTLTTSVRRTSSGFYASLLSCQSIVLILYFLIFFSTELSKTCILIKNTVSP